MNTEKLIKKLKKQIEKQGYEENLGQEVVEQYREFAFKSYPYAEAARRVTEFENTVDEL